MISEKDKNQIADDINGLTDSYKKISSDIETRLNLLNKVSGDLKAFNQGPFSKNLCSMDQSASRKFGQIRFVIFQNG